VTELLQQIQKAGIYTCFFSVFWYYCKVLL